MGNKMTINDIAQLSGVAKKYGLSLPEWWKRTV